MTDPYFCRNSAYTATTPDNIFSGLSTYMEELTVLPPVPLLSPALPPGAPVPLKQPCISSRLGESSTLPQPTPLHSAKARAKR